MQTGLGSICNLAALTRTRKRNGLQTSGPKLLNLSIFSSSSGMHWDSPSHHSEIFLLGSKRYTCTKVEGEEVPSISPLSTHPVRLITSNNTKGTKEETIFSKYIIKSTHLSQNHSWPQYFNVFSLSHYHRSLSFMGLKHFLPTSTIAVMLETICMCSPWLMVRDLRSKILLCLTWLHQNSALHLAH